MTKYHTSNNVQEPTWNLEILITWKRPNNVEVPDRKRAGVNKSLLLDHFTFSLLK